MPDIRRPHLKYYLCASIQSSMLTHPDRRSPHHDRRMQSQTPYTPNQITADGLGIASHIFDYFEHITVILI
jgi:hypothetical protein